MIDETETVVKLQGLLSLRDTHEVRQRLMEALETGNSVALDVRDLTEVDLSILQLLIAARVSAKHHGVDLRLVTANDGIFQGALERFGLLEAH